jgi:hypothetical protein
MASPSPCCGEFYDFVYVCDESYEFMYVCGLSMHQKCSNYVLTNLLFGLCRSMWIIDSLVTHPSPHPTALAQLLTPNSGAYPNRFVFCCFHFWIRIWIYQGVWGCVHSYWTRSNFENILHACEIWTTHALDAWVGKVDKIRVAYF